MLTHLKLFFLNMSMQKKLSLIIIIFVIVPMLTTGLVSYQNYTRNLKEKAIELIMQSSNQMTSRLDDYIGEMKSITAIPIYSRELQQLLMKPGPYLERSDSIAFYLRFMNNMRKGNDAVYILDRDGNIFYNDKRFAVRANTEERFSQFQKIVASANGSAVVQGTETMLDTFGRPKEIFSVIREIRDSELGTYQSLGTVIVDSDIRVIGDAVDRLNDITHGSSYILDANGLNIYRNQNTSVELPPALINTVNRETGGWRDIQIANKSYIFLYTPLKNADWMFYSLIPTQSLFKEAAIIRNVTLMVILIVGLLSLVLAIFTANALTKPLRKLTRVMRTVESGTMEAKFPVKYRDEIGTLGTTFNQMITRIQELIQEVYIVNMKKVVAQLEALQAQINPHFIYNTLETIRMRAIINKDVDVADMTYTLGNLLRYGILRENEQVTVQQELDHLDNYIQLQNHRFRNKFKLQLDVPEPLLQAKVIKLLFQPIVENAIYHGLEHKLGDGLITIVGIQEEEGIRFTISDNGIGMSSEQEVELQQHLEHPSENVRKSDKGIGLRNVHQRIQIQYGKSYGLQVKSRLGEGTTVTVTMCNQPSWGE
ncbi:hypothetical protein A8709_14315 [Paenibacillus pectinilyticus]|uniref:histidine kinase n=1 Tax=Paenibacillus pectinilyticus TaxID=512399 RepID=A0A1C1A3Y5_9BACL|nr:sensor histidine kinase [Paenibacillus pectinilyticus]OCT15269.1 hypothetical protein A8709_14315 [Paenibacillus pectinilyticus]